MAFDLFPYRTFQVIGVLQIIMGILFVCEGCVRTGIVLVLTYSDSISIIYLPPIVDVVTHAVLRFGAIVVGIIVIVTGGMAVSMTRNRRNRLGCLKKGFLILSILTMVGLTPAMIFLYVNRTINVLTVPSLRRLKDMGMWIELLVFAVLAFLQFLLSIISTAVCCCSPLPDVGEEMEMPPVTETNPTQNGGRQIDQGDYDKYRYENPAYDTGTTKVFIPSP